MSCAGYFERLLRQEALDQKQLQKIEEKIHMLKRRILSLEVQGDFHKAVIMKEKLWKLEKIMERTKKLLEVTK